MRIVALEEHVVFPDLVARIPPDAIEVWGWPREMPPHMRHDARLADLGAGRIAGMDEAGITVQVLSTVGPGSDLLAGEDALRFARDCNDRVAQAVLARSDRLAGSAHLPMSSIPAFRLPPCAKPISRNSPAKPATSSRPPAGYPSAQPGRQAQDQLRQRRHTAWPDAIRGLNPPTLRRKPTMPAISSIRLGSYSIAGCKPFAGVLLDGDQVLAVEALKEVCTALDLPLSGAGATLDLLQDWERNLRSIRAALMHRASELPSVPLDRLRQHAPVLQPRQVICMGANYRKHVVDLMVAQGGGAATEGMSEGERRRDAEAMMDERAANGRPYAWVKTQTAVAGPNDDLLLPAGTQQPDWELELAVVIGKAARNIPRAAALDYVAGYMVANDITARDLIYRPDIEAIGTDWLAGKGGPGFLPTGPFIVPRDEVADPHALRITLEVNGQVMQDESTADMIFDIPRQIEHISACMQLLPGDVVCTGSPAGNGAHHNRYLRGGDVMKGEITGLGRQTVRCVA